MATSQNGWPAGLGAAPFVVEGVAFPQGVTAGDAAVVLGHVAEQFHRRVEPLHPGWCWGYAYRDIRGSSGLSNHASGTAIDVNAPDHPLGTSPSASFSPAQIDTVHAILAEVEHAVRWGGDYVGRQDPMHFEIDVSPAGLAPVAARVRGAASSTARKALNLMIERPLVAGENVGAVICPTGSASSIVARAWISVRVAGGAHVKLYFQRSADTDGPAPGAGPPQDWTLRSAARGWAEVPSGTEYIEYDVDAQGPGCLAVELQAK